MKKDINFGIGFITGRSNVCNIINSYYTQWMEQVEELDANVNFVVFVLYDLEYLNEKKENFYKINPNVHKNIKLEYITPEEIEKIKKKIVEDHKMTEEEVNCIIGKGYAKARNTILYSALSKKMDYLLYWDDDEYPVANVLDDEGNLVWQKQNNVLQHIKNIEDVEVTMGYRCGMMNPVPYVEYNEDISKEDYKMFIDALENEVISWEEIQKIENDRECVEFAKTDIANSEKQVEYMENIGTENYVLGSGICLNLQKLDTLPAFYNPPGARGEDTFFSCSLALKNARVKRIPVYHFHDTFLKYKCLMEKQFPEKMKNIELKDDNIRERFYKTTIGWTKYKPLLYYITKRQEYEEIMNKAKLNFQQSIPKVNKIFETEKYFNLLDELEKYSSNVEVHYQEYIKTMKLWDKIKKEIK